MLIDHIDARVRNLAGVRPLYDALFTAMGYTEVHADDDSAGYHIPGDRGTSAFIWFAEDSAHAPNGTRIALAASTRADVDRFSAIAAENGARAYEAPQLVTEYGPAYYASFFEDAEGNKFEICCRRAP